jgi:phage-related protein
MDKEQLPKPLFWIASSRDDLKEFPDEAQDAIGFSLWHAQIGQKHDNAKPLKGFGGAGVLEIVEDYGGNAYRAVYTIRYAGAVYVLHAFQKKSKQQSRTPKHEMILVKRRLKSAQEHYENWQKQIDKG